MLLFSGIRWNVNHRQIGIKRFFHLPVSIRTVRTSAWLYLHAVGLQSVGRRCTDRTLFRIASKAVCYCTDCNSYFPILDRPFVNYMPLPSLRKIGVYIPCLSSQRAVLFVYIAFYIHTDLCFTLLTIKWRLPILDLMVIIIRLCQVCPPLLSWIASSSLVCQEPHISANEISRSHSFISLLTQRKVA